MPTVLRFDGYRFYFFAGDGEEPIHIHVSKGDGYGKIWMEPQIRVQELVGFKSKEEKRILDIVEDHSETLRNSWHEYFSRS